MITEAEVRKYAERCLGGCAEVHFDGGEIVIRFGVHGVTIIPGKDEWESSSAEFIQKCVKPAVGLLI